MKFETNISRIGVTLHKGNQDRVFVEIDLPMPYVVRPSSGLLLLEFPTNEGEGVEYVRKNFGVEPDVDIYDGHRIYTEKKGDKL